MQVTITPMAKKINKKVLSLHNNKQIQIQIQKNKNKKVKKIKSK
jgi:hypothetical protein